MDFKSEKPIYRQIVDLICDNIATGVWPEGERIPSVRELGAQLQVNPNTAMRAYERLQQSSIIAVQRGMGYSVCEGAKEQVLDLRRAEFRSELLPEFVNRMRILGIPMSEVAEAYNQEAEE